MDNDEILAELKTFSKSEATLAVFTAWALGLNTALLVGGLTAQVYFLVLLIFGALMSVASRGSEELRTAALIQTPLWPITLLVGFFQLFPSPDQQQTD